MRKIITTILEIVAINSAVLYAPCYIYKEAC